MSGKYALIIGNTEYIDSGLAQLTAPGKDTEDFARILRDKDLCAFDEVKILLNQSSSSVIETVDEFFDQKKPDDMLVLYFSGHGVRDEMGLLYLAVKNTIRSRLRSTAIRSDYIREAMDQSRSKRQILILDCCNSGAFPQGTKAEVGGAMGMTRAFQGYGRFVLTASDATQFAWEGDQVIGQTDNSLFTHFLVKGLEGDADSDGDGKITVDELYDYAYDQISRVTPKQTPTKSASKQEGEIVLRQITRLEQIKPVLLPDELIEATEDSRPFVREGAVQQLEKLLNSKRLGLGRSAREELERIEKEDDSRRVSQAATQALEAIRQAEKAEEERKAREEAERIATQKAEEERIAQEKADREAKAEAEQKAKEEAERLLAQQKVEAERITKQKAEQERLAREKADREAKAEAERKAKEEAEKLALAKAKLEADRFAEEMRRAKEQAEKERKTREAAQRLAAQKAEEARKLALEQETEQTQKTGEEMKSPSVATPVVVHQKTNASQSIPRQRSFLTGIMIGVIGVCSLLAIGTWGIFSWLSNVATPWPTETATEVVALTEVSTTEVPAAEETATEATETTVSIPVFTFESFCSNPNATVLNLGEYNDISGIAFSPDGCLIASATWNVGVQIWNIQNSSIITRIDYYDWRDYKNFAIPNSVAFSPDGQTLAVGKVQSYNSSDELGKVGGISLYQVSDGTKLLDFKGEVTSVRSRLTFSPDGQVVASLYTTSSVLNPPLSDWAIGFWQASDGTLLTTIPGHSIAYSPNGEFLASASGDNGITIWQVSNDIPSNSVKTLVAGFAIDNVAFLPDGKTLASSGKMGIVLWNISDGTTIRTLDTNNGENFAFSPDGEKVAYSICKAECNMYQSDPSNFPIIVLRVSDGTLLKTFEGHTGQVFSLAFSPDGQTLASSGRGNNIRIWNLTP